MRKIIAIILLVIIAVGIGLTLTKIPFGVPKKEVGNYYVNKGIQQTGATNIITSVVLNYRGFDTLGEVTILFIAALGLGAVVSTITTKKKGDITEPSAVLSTGCQFLFPLILLFGTYIFVHGHLTPGGGFQGGAIIASAFALKYLGCRERRLKRKTLNIVESLGGLVFIVVGLLGLTFGGYFLLNFLPKGTPNSLFSAGIIPVIYAAIGFKVGSELTGIIIDLIEET